MASERARTLRRCRFPENHLLSVAKAVEALHDAGIIHGAIRPATIRLTPHGRAKLETPRFASLTADEARWIATPAGPSRGRIPCSGADGAAVGCRQTREHLRGMTMVSENEGWAVGAHGTLLHYTTGHWQTEQRPTQKDLHAVFHAL